jgi:Ca-activated chloride channel family protein
MRHTPVLALASTIALAGCASAHATQPAHAPAGPVSVDDAEGTPPAATATVANDDGPPAKGPWIGAGGESEVLLASGGESFLGVWVDVPTTAHAKTRAPVDLELVVDTSGSMEGAKIQAARASARTLIQRLADGDIVSIDTFSDNAKTLVAPTVVDARTRARLLSAVAELGTGGSTNMFEGLGLAEAHIAQAPESHAVRRIVMISDGQANVGPSSPEALGQLAERALRVGAQVTSLGVGLDYDEHTLDAIAERTSGRLFHVGDPREMTATLEHEMDLLGQTAANQAEIEVVPATGVQILGVEGARMDWAGDGAVRIPLGALFAGQHKEALLRVRLGQAAVGSQRALASVRLKFHDPSEGGLERVQEVLARADTTSDPTLVSMHANAKTHALMAVMEASKVELQAAQDMSSGNFTGAGQQLAQAEANVRAEAARTTDVAARKKLDKAAAALSAAGASCAAAPSAPPMDVRSDTLKMNQDAMRLQGF